MAVADGGDGVGGDGVSSLPPSLCEDGAARLRCPWRFVDGEEPLQGEARLDDGAGALRERDGEVVVLDGDEQAGGFEVGDDLFARDEAVEAVVGRAGQVDVRGLVEDGERGQRVALADGEVVGVVRGRDLDRAGAELGLRPVVGEDGDLAVRAAVDGAQWQRDELADEVRCSARRSG